MAPLRPTRLCREHESVVVVRPRILRAVFAAKPARQASAPARALWHVVTRTSQELSQRRLHQSNTILGCLPATVGISPYASSAQRKPTFPVDASSVLPWRAATRYRRQYEAWQR